MVGTPRSQNCIYSIWPCHIPKFTFLPYKLCSRAGFLSFQNFGVRPRVRSCPIRNRASKIEGENYFRFHPKPPYFWNPWDIVWWKITKFYYWDPLGPDFWPLFGRHLLFLICTVEHHVTLLIESLHISLLNFELL